MSKPYLKEGSNLFRNCFLINNTHSPIYAFIKVVPNLAPKTVSNEYIILQKWNILF